MNELKNYVDQLNLWESVMRFGNIKIGLYELDTHQGRQRVADRIDSALSPESLTCDGELPIREIKARHKILTTAARQLIKLDSSVKFCEYME